MDSKTKPTAESDTRFPLLGEDGKPWLEGKKFVSPGNDGNLVSYYPVPAPDDLKAFQVLLKDFQQRFLHYVDRGYNVVRTTPEKLDEYITKERRDYKGLVLKYAESLVDATPEKTPELSKLVTTLADSTKAENIDKPVNYGYLESLQRVEEITGGAKGNPNLSVAQRREIKNLETEKDLTGRWLSTALIGRAMRHAKHHLKLRVSNNGGNEARLTELYKSVSADTAEVYGISANLRAKRGYVDEDRVIGEMLGEPQKLFLASLSGQPDGIRAFYEARYEKVSQAMHSIDSTVKAIGTITKAYPDFKEPMEEMARAAKRKIQMQHGDADYPAADKGYIASRDEVQQLISDRQKQIMHAQESPATSRMRDIQRSKTAPDVRAMNALKQATDLIYDIAVTRDPRDFGVKQLEQEIAAADLSHPLILHKR